MRMIVACAVAVAGISATFGGAEPLRERAVVEEGVRTADYQLCRRSTDAHGGRTSAKGPCTSGTPDESVLWGHLSLTANSGSF